MIQDDTKGWRRDDGPRDDVPDVDLASTLRALRGGLARQWRLIAAVTLALLLAVGAYVLLATPQYTARAEVVIDPRIANSLSGPEAPTLLLSDALVVDSELKVMSSREVTTAAAEALGLFDAVPEEDEDGAFDAVRELLQSALSQPGDAAVPPPSDANEETSRREMIRRTLMEGFDIRRDGGTYVIGIAYTSPDPVFAMQAVNTLIDAYFRVSANASLADTRRIASWLDQRVQVLAGEVEQADRAVAAYRRENELFTMREGILPSEAELTSATDRLIGLRSDLIGIQTRQDKIRDIVASASAGALMDGTLGGDVASPALRDFQTRYAGLVSEERDLVTRWGASSDIVARNREDQAQLRDLMLEEAGQIGERMDTQQEAIRREIVATEAQVAQLRERASADAEKSIRLRELERDAEAKRSQYGSMLQEMISAAQRETFQRAPARVIARAVPPDQVSSPRAKRLLALSVFAGLILGSGLGFLREVTDDRLRRPGDLREGLGLRPLGFMPGIPAPGRRLRDPSALLRLPPGNAEARRSLRGLIARMQRLKPDQGALVTGIGAISRGAGRGGLAALLAGSMAEAGERTMLIDLDPATGGPLAQLPGRIVLSGLGGRLDADAELDRLALAAEPDRPLIVALAADADLLSPAQQRGLAALLTALRPHLDHILLILPPQSERAEAEIAGALADRVVLALRWGATGQPEAAEALAAAGTLPSRLIGAIFTAEDRRGFARYNR
ncbi:GumC family protein [Paracoccus spongiarum]|uniref:Exopolysaccharide transport family protein n=1 Tax=Paracoccus spongiarum TaxID=3064387 RepID=A0ABT9JCK8_9RHOB|nr:exopolysaccharide transport family protein [Paracoccus sp. 2205BS29-5]MDP5307514.1 exopolysaccharide transport family protein [Paracoccus sp. 2205BS29-5]